MKDFAYTAYEIHYIGSGRYEVYTETNDDGDTGMPGVFAQWRFMFDNLDQVKRHTGVSRQGVGQRVYVRFEGREINSEEDWPSA